MSAPTTTVGAVAPVSCAVCGGAGPYKCPCRTVAYCSVECQRAHWPSHKAVCPARVKPGAGGSGARASDKEAGGGRVTGGRSGGDGGGGADTYAEQLRMLKEVVAAHASGRRVRPPSSSPSLFISLLDESAFRTHVYPGVDVTTLPSHAPTRLADVLLSDKHRATVDAAAARAMTQAREVIARVKASAAKRGEVMDAATEAMVLPTAFAEGMAAELPAMVRGIVSAGDVHAVPTAVGADVASPYHVLAASTYLQPVVFAGLADRGQGWALQDSLFVGEDAGAWAQLVLDDCVRLGQAGSGGEDEGGSTSRWSRPVERTAPSSAGGATATSSVSYTWVDPSSDVDDEYPALSEVVQRLHATPYQINRTAREWRVAAPQTGHTLVRRWRYTLSPDGRDAAWPPILPLGSTYRAWTTATPATTTLPKVALVYMSGWHLDGTGAGADEGGQDRGAGHGGEECEPPTLRWRFKRPDGVAEGDGAGHVDCVRGNTVLALRCDSPWVQTSIMPPAMVGSHGGSGASATWTAYTVEFYIMGAA